MSQSRKFHLENFLIRFIYIALRMTPQTYVFKGCSVQLLRQVRQAPSRLWGYF